ncbi:DUF6164 family protein [Arenimonas composti]|uniref:Transmembrane protein n=1 Tax=Arenimonas composti TR7-09 = DSM 18010 TaxID=1121013 RepID=A0A091B786_9GAMM|nr:DUF6164 family protein [Arenimonas composti]KFN47362.1 hypothetical protein P873_01590 [Arenimonas composti TR7-09 = DSM 18010]
MAKLVFNLRNVPDDEADEVRALLDARRIDWYETRPSLWGISGGGLWVKDDAQADAARAHLADYQAERARCARAARAEDLREGRVEGSLEGMRRRPLQSLLAIFGILMMLALVMLPALLLR